MLKSLSVRNYALIESLDTDFPEGFSVITGETGAGKSILLGAIGLLIGNRADISAIRGEASKCTIEGIFNVSGYDLQGFFSENELEYDDECIVRRELFPSGKSRAFINDTPTSLAVLKELGSHLIDIHSQHQNLLLNTEGFQLDVLDTLADDRNEREAYRQAYLDCCQAEEALRQTEDKLRQARADEEFIRFQLQQFNDARLYEGEDEELEEEQALLSHAEDIKSNLYAVSNALDNEEANCLSSIKGCIGTLHGLEANFAKASEWAERLESAYIELKDICDEVDDAKERIAFNPERLAIVEERLSLIYTMLQKHHVHSITELLTIEKTYRDRLAAIDGGEERMELLHEAVQMARRRRATAAEALTACRRKAATMVEQEIIQRLIPLGMPHIRFAVNIIPRTEPSEDGMDSVTFLFSANKSSSLQNIADVASGGEISRVMLAIKAMMASARRMPTILFDEIDTGISGNIADRMGGIMKEMSSKGRQIISITHLPQIAAKGSAHYRVSKSETLSGTVTSIDRLSPEERIIEIASMMSGAKLTDAAVNNAKELLAQQTH